MPSFKVVTGQKPRQIAARVLAQRQSGTFYTENLLDSELARNPLPPKDRALCQELVYGVVRHAAELDWLISHKTAGRTQKPKLQILLQLGLYQMFWLDRVPDHASVNEMVELAKRSGFGPQSGFVNAVLRGYSREREATLALLADLKVNQPALGHSHPQWLYDRWLTRWGAEKTARLMDWNNRPASTFARLNSLTTSAAALESEWRIDRVQFEPRQWDWTGAGLVYELQSHPSLSEMTSFKAGWFYVQDPSTLLAVTELNPQPGDSALDLCAAPGGKTTFIAQLMQNKGRVVAEDLDKDRLELVRENVARMKTTCVEVRASGTGPKDEKFDRVLVDAPCSNSGVMRRRVDVRWRISLAEIERLKTTQLALLGRAAQMVKSSGTLVYSTCSLEPEENSEVISLFLKCESSFKLVRERELIPFTDGTDGAYVAKLTRA
jgi:16S rRNA (cytosine967-C5)-methyltransferase